MTERDICLSCHLAVCTPMTGQCPLKPVQITREPFDRKAWRKAYNARRRSEEFRAKRREAYHATNERERRRDYWREYKRRVNGQTRGKNSIRDSGTYPRRVDASLGLRDGKGS